MGVCCAHKPYFLMPGHIYYCNSCEHSAFATCTLKNAYIVIFKTNHLLMCNDMRRLQNVRPQRFNQGIINFIQILKSLDFYYFNMDFTKI